MKVITAIESLDNLQDYVTIFLAGGITNCPPWQNQIIKLLEPCDNAIIFNPRRENFPINDPNASKKQIEWEFKALERSDIFSVWFSDGPSVQPITMYEFGRHMAKRNPKTIAIGVDDGYLRKQDVYIQTGLASSIAVKKIANTLEGHAKNILDLVKLYNTNYMS